MKLKIVGIIILTLLVTIVFSTGTINDLSAQNEKQLLTISDKMDYSSSLKDSDDNVDRGILDRLQMWQWGQRAGSTDFDQGYNIAVDTNSNSYVIGEFRGTADFGSTVLTSQGNADVFVAKLDPNGNWLWAQRAGGIDEDIGQDVVVDANGNVYITGYFQNTGDFGTVNLTSQGVYDVFVAKLDTNGNWLWAQRVGGTDWDIGRGIGIDANANIYITGIFGGTAWFGSYSITSSGSWDVFVAKCDTNANWQWAQRSGDWNAQYARDIAVTLSGDAYITGYFWGTLVFGPSSITSVEINDVFVAKCDTNGNWQWGQRAGGISDDWGWRIASDTAGNAYITGYFNGTANFGTTSLSSQGKYDVFVAKLDSLGNWQWTKQAGGTDGDFGYGISVDSNGNVYISGCYYYATAYFGTIPLINQGVEDVFVAMIDTTGTWQWAQQGGWTNGERSYGVAVDSSGNTYVIGYIYSTSKFGVITLISTGSLDVFVAKLLDDNQPTACYTWYDADGVGTGTTINFDATCSSDDYGIVQYDWDWTYDGTYDYTGGPTANHDYGDTNTYICALRVTDTIGQTHTYTMTVHASVETFPDCKMHFPQYPDQFGWDVVAMMLWNDVLADDFLCIQNGPITDLHLWGSWLGDYMPPDGRPVSFHVSIHADVPDPDGEGPLYSMPGELFWEQDVYQFDCMPEEPSLQGWFEPPDWYLQNNHVHYFRYDLFFEPPYFVQTEGMIYWVDIAVVPPLDYCWGWKTSINHFNDDAVYMDPTGMWGELRDPITDQSLDLAFVITGYPDDPPVACFTWIDADGTGTGTAINFDASCSTDDYGIIQYDWDWDGDGVYDNSYAIPTASHDYGDIALHTVWLRVTDTLGQTDLYTDSVQAIVVTLDVNQSTFNRGFPIRHAVDGDWAGGQNFTPTYNTVTKVDIYLRKMGAPEFDLTVELRENHPQGTLHDTLVIPVADVSTSWTWLPIDFADTTVGAGSDVFIVIPPAPLGVTTSYGYEWGYAMGNQYDGGAFWFTRNGGGLWRDLPTMYEFCFRTYGYS